MECPYLSCGAVCSNPLHDLAVERFEMYIPPFMMHLITRPMAHHPLPSVPIGVRGMVIMEFNKQIFRRNIFVPWDGKCPTCGAERDKKDRYEAEIGKAVQHISRCVNRVVKNLLQETLDEVNKHAY